MNKDADQTRAVLFLSGFSPDLHCALCECIDICRGYGLVMDLIKEHVPDTAGIEDMAIDINSFENLGNLNFLANKSTQSREGEIL